MSSESIILQVTDVARGGAGVARDPSGRVIFVPYTAPGDRVRVAVHEKLKNYAQGELIEVLEASPERQTPPCAVFGRCGGCSWQHLSYARQWKTKTDGVKHALKRVQVALPDSWEEYPAEQIWNYRNRIQLRGHGQQIGFYEAGSNRLVPIKECRIARTELNQVLEEVRLEGARLPRPYKVEIEVRPDGSVQKSWNSSHSALGFRQVHDAQNKKLQDWVAKSLTPGKPLLDLFGGFGNLSVPMVGKMSEIHCVDVSVPKPGTGAPGIQFHRSEVLPWVLRLKSVIRLDGRPSSVVLDPPREGLGPDLVSIASALEEAGVNEWAAIGCDPDSWARDVSRLVGARLEAGIGRYPGLLSTNSSC